MEGARMKVGKRQIVCEELDGEDLSVVLEGGGLYQLALEEDVTVYVTLERLLIIKEFLNKHQYLYAQKVS